MEKPRQQGSSEAPVGRGPRRLWDALQDRAHPQEIDPGNATTIGGMVGLVACALELVAVLLHPPTDGVGPVGWVLVGALLTVGGVFSWSLVGREKALTSTALLRLAIGGAAAVVLISAVTGGQPEREVALLWVLFAVAVQPPGRGLLTLAIAALLVIGVAVIQGPDLRGQTQLLFDLLLWTGMVVLAYPLFSRVRRQRGEFREEKAVLNELARRDQLTGLGNRRALEEALRREEGRVQRGSGPCTIAVVDIDGFKQINDYFGHPVGDDLLRGLAGVLSSEVRRPDQGFRWGGDEFVILMPDSERTQAEAAVQRLRAEIERACRAPTGQPLRSRWGVSELTAGMAAHQALSAADQALLQEKRTYARRPVTGLGPFDEESLSAAEAPVE